MRIHLHPMQFLQDCHVEDMMNYTPRFSLMVEVSRLIASLVTDEAFMRARHITERDDFVYRIRSGKLLREIWSQIPTSTEPDHHYMSPCSVLLRGSESVVGGSSREIAACVACVDSMRSAYATSQPVLSALESAWESTGGRSLRIVACFNVSCARGGPALAGGGDEWVGHQDQPFCSRACLASYIAMCKDV